MRGQVEEQGQTRKDSMNKMGAHEPKYEHDEKGKQRVAHNIKEIERAEENAPCGTSNDHVSAFMGWCNV